MFDSFSQHYFAKYISRVTVGNMFVLYYSFLHSLIVETPGKYIKFCKRKKLLDTQKKKTKNDKNCRALFNENFREK
jgi:hypothetical protein